MPSTIEKISPSRVKFTVTITAEELKPHLDQAYREIAKQVNIPGFRRGKVPATIIDQRFGKGVALQEAIQEALPAAYSTALEESGEVPLSEPQIDFEEMGEDGNVVFTAEVDVRPAFDLPDFAKIKATAPNLVIGDDEVEERIEILRKRFATTKEVERAAKKGDVVVIDLAAAQDGEPLADASAEGITYRVGDEGMLDGLEKAVKGLSAGESATFSSKLVGGQSEGTEADITVTVQKVSKETLPKVDDDFAQLVSEFDTVDEMRADLASKVAEMAKFSQIRAARDQALEALIEAIDFEAPANLVESEVAARRTEIEKQLGQMGMTLDSYLAEADEEERKTADEYWADLESNTAKGIKAQIVLDKIAEEREIEVTQQDLAEMLYSRAMQNGTSPDAEMQHMMEHNHMAAWAQEIRRNKALEAVLAEAKIVDEDGKAVNVAPSVVTAKEDSE